MLHSKHFLQNVEGMTLLETMIVIAISAILLTAVAAAMAAGARTWCFTSSATAMSRQANAALSSIASKIRIANEVDLSDPAFPTAVVLRTTGEHRYAFVLSGTDMIMHITYPDGTTSRGITGSDVVFMQVADDRTDSYTIVITCSDYQTSTTASTRVTIRR